MQSISKLLVANRGEIAVRVMRAAKDAGIPTVAIYAVQDRNSPHVLLADEAYALSGTKSQDTYLVPEKIMAIAQLSGANAVHPGYGFLSENADFAQMVIDKGLIWVGPPPAAIRLLGDKVSARRIAHKVGAPLAPGTSNPVASSDEVVSFAQKHGFPVAIKAAHGGGGKGLKVAYTVEEVKEQFDSATRESLAAFGKSECFVEKYLEKPRHVETQCLADAQGTVVVISTRDCTLQRRHQKLVEEAPAPFLTDEQERALYESSKAILGAVGYVGAGTCEFLIGKDGTISFLEVNTRLQVEHPVSEEVTGIDLVREQFRIAEGGTLDYADPVVRGHSIEFRINGEDPGRGFLPSPGKIHSIRLPTGPGVRVDSGVSSGDVVTGDFDSLLAKLIVTGTTRKDAIEKARRALEEFEVTGLPTVLPFHRAILNHGAFSADMADHYAIHTTWIETQSDIRLDPWTGTFQPHENLEEKYRNIVVEVEGRRRVVAVPAGVFSGGSVAPRPPRRRQISSATEASGGSVFAPMQATVASVHVREGQAVVRDELLVTLEAMKMEQGMRSPLDGHVIDVAVSKGETVSAGQVMVSIMPSEPDNPGS